MPTQCRCNTMRVEHAGGILQRLARRHSEADVVEPDAVLVKAVALDGPRGIWKEPDAESDRAVAEKRARIEVHELSEVRTRYRTQRTDRHH
jgi:hypothetical protein